MFGCVFILFIICFIFVIDWFCRNKMVVMVDDFIIDGSGWFLGCFGKFWNEGLVFVVKVLISGVVVSEVL